MIEDTIKVNDVLYIKKSEYDKMMYQKKDEIRKEIMKEKKAMRFASDKEVKIIKALNKIFSGDGQNTITEQYAVENGATVIDACNVCMVSGKSEEAKRVLARFISSEVEIKSMPTMPIWDFKTKEGDICKAKFSMEYLTKIFDFFKIIGSEAVHISLLHNHPCLIEDSDFAFILAPRVEGDD